MSDPRLEEMAREFRESLLETGVGIPGQSQADNRNFDFWLAALLERVREETLSTVQHSDPDECPLWYDGCLCGEAYEYWMKRDAEWVRVVREARDEEWEPDTPVHPERRAGWRAACDEILKRMGVK